MRSRSSLPTKDTLLIVRPTTPFRSRRSLTHPPRGQIAARILTPPMPHRSAKALVSVAALPFFAI